MSTLAIHHDPFVLRDDAGLSEDARQLKDRLESISNDMRKTVSFGEPLRNVYLAIQEILEEGSTDNWDSYGAKAVTQQTYDQALRFLRALSPAVPMPEISLEPDGEFAFDWFRAPGWVFSVSIGGTGDLTYAGVFGKNKTHGTEVFQDEIPKVIMDNLSRLYAER